jgi:PfaD family protein
VLQNIQRKNQLFAKISRPEVAIRFLKPAPPDIVARLLGEGRITEQEAQLSAHVPLAEDIIVEADSGGHTDNQVLGAVFPIILALRDEVARTSGYSRPIRIGAAGGLGCPQAVAAAFSLGAAFVLTGSVNQSAVESGLSERGKKLLAQAGLDDVIMAPAADMFELGVKLQVLSRGTMFGLRAQKLWDLYRAYDSLEALPPEERKKLERDLFQDTLENIWRATYKYFQVRNPKENARAEVDSKHRMALVFRWYLGQSSKWAIVGDEKRGLDYQIWCGPAMGAFNRWVKGTFLEAPENRSVVQIALNLLQGAAVVTRAGQLRTYGVPVPDAAFAYVPRPIDG